VSWRADRFVKIGSGGFVIAAAAYAADEPGKAGNSAAVASDSFKSQSRGKIAVHLAEPRWKYGDHSKDRSGAREVMDEGFA